MLTQKRLKELLHYNPKTGIFVWKVRRQGVRLTTVAGCKEKQHGYVYIKISYKRYAAHRLAWLYVKGKWPKGIIDHKDTIKYHNWIKNLRDVTPTINGQNRIKANSTNQTGFLGVSFHKQSGVYRAKITIGSYLTPELAHAAYVAAKKKLHPNSIT